MQFVHGDVRERARPARRSSRVSGDRRVLGRAVGARRHGRRRRLRRADEPDRRLQLPRARAPRRRPDDLPLDQPRLPGRARSASCALREDETRFDARATSSRCAGASRARDREDFPLEGARTLYGTTKLAAELLVARVRATPSACATVIDRCGVIAGPWQMGKVDQGVFTHWLLSHYTRPAADATSATAAPASRCATCSTSTTSVDLILEQLADPDGWDGATVNVGGGVRGQPVAAGDDRAVPRAHRDARSRSRRSPRTAPGRRAASTSPTARACSRAPSWRPDARAARRCSRTPSTGSARTRTPSLAALW